MSVGPFSGPVQRPSNERDISELFRRVEALERQRPSAAAGSFIAGAVLNDATILLGTGFTAKWSLFDDTHPNENYITIMFDVPFDAGPVVTFGVNNDNNASGGTGDDSEYQVGILTRNVAYIEVVAKELDGTPNIGGFDFRASEPS